MGQFDRKKESQPKHGKPSSSGAYKGPPPMARGIPEDRKGRGYTAKKKPRPQATPAAAPEPPKLDHILPVDLEKRTLEVFRTTFPASNDFEALKLHVAFSLTVSFALCQQHYPVLSSTNC